MINPNWLRTFVTLVETGSYTRTASKLAMTQPGVSQQVQKLEQQLGTCLLAKIGKSFELTVAGDKLYTFAKDSMERQQRFVDELAEDSDQQGELRIASPGSIGLQCYPHLLQLQGQYPGLTLCYEVAPNQRIAAQLLAGEIDLGLVTLVPSEAALKATEVGQERLEIVLPASSKAKSWQDLMQLGFINHPDAYHHAQLCLGKNFPEQYQGLASIPITGYCNQISNILLPVAQGLGFTVIPHFALDNFPQPQKLKTWPQSQPVVETVYFLSKRHKPLPKRYELVMAGLRKFFNAKALSN